MKKLLILLLTLVFTSATFAEKVTEQQALQKAQKFFKDKRIESKNLSRGSKTELDPNATREDFYVFNAENKGGFVIISGDDRTPEILGYADSGNLDMDNLPLNLKGWLDEYSKQIKALEDVGDTGSNALSRAPSIAQKTPIEPLITTKWGQGSPYNHQCPEIDGKHCVTGCVATAMAQVMYYHKWPQEACAALPQYTTATRQIEMPALPSTTFKWNAMRDRYWEGELGESADAVAELMRYCGQAVEMNYDIDQSSAFEMPRHLIQYFGYSKNAKYVTMSQYTESQWEDILYKELSEGRPMLYGGCNLLTAHEFICDGYDGDGYYHFNWGWDGDANGFFLLSVMFNEAIGGGIVYGQTAIIGLQPDNGASTIPYVYGYHGGDLTQTEYLRSSTSENFSNISLTEGAYIQYEIADNQDVSLEYGLGLYKDTQLLTVLDQSSAVLNLNNNTVYKQTNVAFGKYLEDGVYQIRSIYKFTDNNDWEACTDSYVNYIVATISANNLVLRKVCDASTENATYIVNNISLLGNIATVNLTNTGDTNQEMLFFWTKNEIGRLAFFDSACGAIESGKTGDVIFPIHFYYNRSTPIIITADLNGERIMWEGNVTTPEKEVGQLICSNYSIDNYQNGILMDSKAHITLTIKNIGQNVYNDNIQCDVDLFSDLYKIGVYRIFQQVLINVGETKDIEFEIPHLDNNRKYEILFHYNEGTLYCNEGYSPISFLVGKNCVNDNGITYAFFQKSKTANVISGDYQNLESIKIPPTITIEGDYYNVTEVAPCAFKGYHFQSVDLPEGLLAINLKAFESCSISTLSLPSSLKMIGQEAFMLTTSLKEISVPEGVISIEYAAFRDCWDLETLRLPSTLKSIDYDVIFNCNNLKSVYSAMTDPIDVTENTFASVSNSVTLYVPKGSVSKYQEATGWNVFTKITDKLPGDANGDGELNETDRNYIIRHIMGDTPDDFDEEAANLNGDEKIDVADIVLLNKSLGENTSSLP